MKGEKVFLNKQLDFIKRMEKIIVRINNFLPNKG